MVANPKFLIKANIGINAIHPFSFNKRQLIFTHTKAAIETRRNKKPTVNHVRISISTGKVHGVKTPFIKIDPIKEIPVYQM